MTFEDWAKEYFGENVSVPEACRDAWMAARDACAKVCEEADYYERTGFEYAEDIRERVK